MKTAVRKATIRDLEFISTCAELAYDKYVMPIGKKPAPMVADFKSSIAKEQVDLLILKSQPVGFAVWYLAQDCLFLENIALHPDQQGKGLSRKLFNHLEQIARTNAKPAIELYTNEKMTDNIALYQYLGFEEIDRRRENGFSRIWFRKKLL